MSSFVKDGQTSGKCWKCKLRFVWKGKPLLRDAYCCRCKTKLEKTTHLNKWPIVEQKPTSKPLKL